MNGYQSKTCQILRLEIDIKWYMLKIYVKILTFSSVSFLTSSSSNLLLSYSLFPTYSFLLEFFASFSFLPLEEERQSNSVIFNVKLSLKIWWISFIFLTFQSLVIHFLAPSLPISLSLSPLSSLSYFILILSTHLILHLSLSLSLSVELWYSRTTLILGVVFVFAYIMSWGWMTYVMEETARNSVSWFFSPQLSASSDFSLLSSFFFSPFHFLHLFAPSSFQHTFCIHTPNLFHVLIFYWVTVTRRRLWVIALIVTRNYNYIQFLEKFCQPFLTLTFSFFSSTLSFFYPLSNFFLSLSSFLFLYYFFPLMRWGSVSHPLSFPFNWLTSFRLIETGVVLVVSLLVWVGKSDSLMMGRVAHVLLCTDSLTLSSFPSHSIPFSIIFSFLSLSLLPFLSFHFSCSSFIEWWN